MNKYLAYFCLSALLVTDLVNSEVIPVPGDCTKYQVCDYSGCFVFNCGIGTEFNPRINVCDYPLRDRGQCGSFGELGLLAVSPVGQQQQQPAINYPSVGVGQPPQGPTTTLPAGPRPNYPNGGGYYQGGGGGGNQGGGGGGYYQGGGGGGGNQAGGYPANSVSTGCRR